LARRVGGDLIWFGPLQRVQNLLFRTPMVNLFVVGSEIYHDYVRWPMIERRRAAKWARTTPWGRLFDRYASGPLAAA
jgi:hypothetical protein